MRLRAAAGSLVGGEVWLMVVAVAAGMLSTRLLPVGVMLAGLLFVARWVHSGSLSIRTPLDLPILFLVLWSPLTLLVTAFPEITLPQVLRLLLGIGLFFSLVNWTVARSRLGWMVTGLILAGFGLVILAPFGVTWYTENKLSFIPDFVYTRSILLVSDTIHPNVMGGNLAILLPIPFSLLVFKGRSFGRVPRLALWVVCLLMGGMLFLTKSRGAWMGFGVAVVIIGLIAYARSWKTYLALSILGLLSLYGLISSSLLNTLLSLDVLGGVEGRLEIFSRSLLVIRDFPFTGIGMGSYHQIVDTFYPFFLYAPGQIVHAHNLFLQIAIDLGIPGLAAWLAIYCGLFFIVVKVFLQAKKDDDRFLTALGAGMIGSQVALAVHGLTDAVTWGMVKPAPLVWALWGVSVAMFNVQSNERKLLSGLVGHSSIDGEPDPSAIPAPPRANILGVGVSAINMDQAVATIQNWIIRRLSRYVCVTPAHGIMECRHDPELRHIFNSSGLTTPDGMSIVWLLRAKGYQHVSRVYGPDLMLAVCERSVEHGWRHYFYGGEPSVAEQLAERLAARFPGLQVAGVYSPPFRLLTPEEDHDVVQQINNAQADIVWVGISTPKQERWMAEHCHRLSAPVMVGVGAAFDFLSGNKAQAPVWVQRAGLEWLFRLATEPRRLWKRYIQYPYFGLLVLAQEMGFHRYTLEPETSQADGLKIG